MKKQIANILTSVRMIISSILLTFSRLDAAFLALFCVCGITDLIDGPIARATGSQSLLGAKLDTAGDVLTYFAMAKVLILKKVISVKTLLWFAVPLLGMLLSALIGWLKHHTLVFAHTALAKLFGAGCFLVPFSVAANTISLYLTVLWFVACLAGVEMIEIQIFSNHADPDILSLLCIKKSNDSFRESLEKGVAEGTVREK